MHGAANGSVISEQPFWGARTRQPVICEPELPLLSLLETQAVAASAGRRKQASAGVGLTLSAAHG